MSEQAEKPESEQPLAGRQIGYLLEAPDRVGANLAQQMMALRDLGAEVTAIFMTGDPATASLDGVADHRLGLKLPKKALSGMRLRLAWRLRSALRTANLDTLVCDQYKAVTAATLATAVPFSGRPRLYALLRGFYATDSRSRQRVYRFLRRRLAGIITLTGPQRDRVLSNLDWLPPAHVHIVPNHIDGEALRQQMLPRQDARGALGIPNDAFVFGCIARFDPYKRITDLLKAFATAAEKNQDSRLVIIGDGREANALHAEADGLGINPRVHFTGFISGASRYMPAFDVFVLPSEGDNFARVFLEAAAAGLPIIGVDGGGTPEVLQDAAPVVPRRNPERLAQAMLHVQGMNASVRRAESLQTQGRLETRYTAAALAEQLERAVTFPPR